jgi:DNA uptake protein ComE-like DNA-binding protein
MKDSRIRFVYAQRLVFAMFTVSGLACLTACQPPASDQRLQDQAAHATEVAKQQSAEALAQAKVAAGNAEKAVNDVAAGVKQGLDNKTAPAGAQRVDLNEGSTIDLAGLPGISLVKARQIIDHRPYTSTHDLVKSGILSERQFQDIASKITVR